MLNRVILIGRLTRDPELRYTQSGVPVANFSLAVDRQFKSDNGERETDFIECVAWRKLGETIANHLQKGRLIGLEGSLRTRSYETNDGQKRKVSEVVVDDFNFLDKPKDGASNPAPARSGGSTAFDNLDLDDDVPF